MSCSQDMEWVNFKSTSQIVEFVKEMVYLNASYSERQGLTAEQFFFLSFLYFYGDLSICKTWARWFLFYIKTDQRKHVKV